MIPSEPQLPKSLSGFKYSTADLPDKVSDVLLPAPVGGKWKNGVRVIDRSKDRLGINATAARYNQVSTDLTNMRKSGDAAKFSAAKAEESNKNNPKKPPIKIRSN